MLKDSGARRTFATGAVRDIAEEKGRCDLLPLKIVGIWLDQQPAVPPLLKNILLDLDSYVRSGRSAALYSALTTFAQIAYNGSVATALLEVSKHYEEGAQKYAERNWEKGISLHCYLDSAVRHLLKYQRGDTDEPHDRAFTWNILGLLWTDQAYCNIPEIIDLPLAQEDEDEDDEEEEEYNDDYYNKY